MKSNRVVKKDQEELERIAKDLESYITAARGVLGPALIQQMAYNKLWIRLFIKNLDHRYVRKENGNGSRKVAGNAQHATKDKSGKDDIHRY